MKAVLCLTCLATILGLAAPAHAQTFRGQPAPKQQQPAATTQPLQNRVQPITQGVQQQSNITPPPMTTNQFLPQNPFNAYNNYPMMNANPYTPFTPYQTTPIMNANPYAPSLINPAFNPYQVQNPLSPFNSLTPAQQLFLQQQNGLNPYANPYANPYNPFPMNPLLQNNFAPVVGVGGAGFVGGR